jgi:hypothetical protein
MQLTKIFKTYSQRVAEVTLLKPSRIKDCRFEEFENPGRSWGVEEDDSGGG